MTANLHPQAPKAAEAARCAQDEGKFWEYHDALFAAALRATADELKAYAQQVGLDAARFEGCLSGGTHQAAVQADLEEGSRLGVNGTPAFFINSRFIWRGQPLESVVKLIHAEIARAKVAPARQTGGHKMDAPEASRRRSIEIELEAPGGMGNPGGR